MAFSRAMRSGSRTWSGCAPSTSQASTYDVLDLTGLQHAVNLETIGSARQPDLGPDPARGPAPPQADRTRRQPRHRHFTAGRESGHRTWRPDLPSGEPARRPVDCGVDTRARVERRIRGLPRRSRRRHPVRDGIGPRRDGQRRHRTYSGCRLLRTRGSSVGGRRDLHDGVGHTGRLAHRSRSLAGHRTRRAGQATTS